MGNEIDKHPPTLGNTFGGIRRKNKVFGHVVLLAVRFALTTVADLSWCIRWRRIAVR